MKFANLVKKAEELRAQLQELQSTAYVIYPVGSDYKFVAYFDAEEMAMGYAVTDRNFVDIKLLSDLPASVVVEFGKFVDTLEQWQNTSDMDFPFSHYAGDNKEPPVLRSEFEYVPRDADLDAPEAELR